MLVLIYGGYGWIGTQIIIELIKLNITYIIGIKRADNPTDIETEILQINPTHVYSCIGKTHNSTINSSDYLENKETIYENLRDNLYSPIILAQITKKIGIHYTYIGTGCIYNYDLNHTCENNIGFTESDIPNFYNSNYSLVKSYTDQLMQLFNNTLTVRIRMPITNNLLDKRNFINRLINFKYIYSTPNSWSVLPELLPILVDMTIKKQVGTINLVNPGTISHNEILSLYKTMINNDYTWISLKNECMTNKKSNNCLDTTKLKTLYTNILNIKDSIKKYSLIENMCNNKYE